MKCKDLHNYANIRNDAEVKIDICVQCKKKYIARKGKREEIDNETYYQEHKRNFLQPSDKYYKKYYENNIL